MASSSTTTNSTTIKGGYWPSWSSSKFPPSEIPPHLFTHVFYAFVEIDPKSFQLSLTQSKKNQMKSFTTTLHSMTPQPKAILSIGGSNSSPDAFSAIAADPIKRSSFIRSAINAAREHGFDGLDLDWEFPKTPRDMSNLAMLLKEWHEAIEELASSVFGSPRLLLSMAVYFAPEFRFFGERRTYPIEAIEEYVDFVCPMCYDYRGSWDTSATGGHSLLYDKSSCMISTSFGVSSWISSGVPPGRIVMGIPLHGKTWKLKNPDRNRIGAAAVGVGVGNKGVMTYSQIVGFNKARGATEKYDEETVSMYSYVGSDWIGYDGPESVEKKVKFARDKGLAGYFFWALGFDKDWTLSKTASGTWDH